MAEFLADLQSFRPLFPVSDIDANMEIINQYAGLNPTTMLTTSDLDLQGFMPFSNDNFFSHQAPDNGNLAENFPGAVHQFNQNVLPIAQPINAAAGNEFHEKSKRKAMDKPESSSGTSSTPVSETGIQRRNVMFYILCFLVLLFRLENDYIRGI